MSIGLAVQGQDEAGTKQIYCICNGDLLLQGRPYEDKMKWDRTEMLHWLQEERKHNALRFESLMRHIPLKPAFLEPITGGAQ